MDQRSGVGRFSGWIKILVIYTWFFNAEFWSTWCEDCFGTEQNHPEYPLQKKRQSGRTKGPEAVPFPSRQTDCLLDLRSLLGHRSPWFCWELCRPVYSCSSKWWYSRIRFEMGRNSTTSGANPAWWHLGSIVQIKNRESEKLKTILELYDLEIHQKKLGPDYHRLKTMVKRSIEQDIRNEFWGQKWKLWDKRRGQESGNKTAWAKKVWEIVGNWSPTGSVLKETIAFTGTISISVRNRHCRILLRDLLHGRVWEMHREPEVRVEECFDCPARITSKELAPLHSEKSGILQNACSTSSRVDADLGKVLLCASPGWWTTWEKVEKNGENHVRITNFRGRNRKTSIHSKSSSFSMVLWHGRSCKEMCGTILWVGKQDDATTLQSIYSMHRRPPLQRRRNKICWRIVKYMLSNCSEMLYLALIGRPDILWSVNKFARFDYEMDQSLWQTPESIDFIHSSHMWIQTVLLCG